MDTKKQADEETRKLTFFVIFMSMIVAILFSL